MSTKVGNAPPSSSLLERLMPLAISGELSAAEFAVLATELATGNEMKARTITSLLPMRDASPATFKATLAALLQRPPPSTSSPLPIASPPVLPSAHSTVPKSNASPPNPPVITLNATDVVRRMMPPQDIQEVIAVCIDVSGSMKTPFESDPDPRVKCRNRLEAMKQCFYGFRDQTANFTDGTHRLGLLSYDNRVQIHTAPTADFASFEKVIDGMQCRGRTAIYKAIHEACEMIAPFREKSHPQRDLRVLCLSDGQNNCNDTKPEDVLRKLLDIGAVCDCIIVGNKPDANLLRIVSASGGSCFQITCLADAFEVLESEAVISLKSRRNGAPRPQAKTKAVPLNFQKVALAKPTTGAVVVKAAATTSMPAGAGAGAAGAGAAVVFCSLPEATKLLKPTSVTSATQKRIRKEILRLQSVASPHMALFQFRVGHVQGDVSCLEVLMKGVAGTPYASGRFKVLISFPSGYPFKPPRLVFETPIYHYAVSTQGHICLPILNSQWSPAKSVEGVLQQLRELIMTPDQFDPVCNYSQRSWLSELKRVNPAQYNTDAVAFTQAHAT